MYDRMFKAIEESNGNGNFKNENEMLYGSGSQSSISREIEGMHK